MTKPDMNRLTWAILGDGGTGLPACATRMKSMFAKHLILLLPFVGIQQSAAQVFLEDFDDRDFDSPFVVVVAPNGFTSFDNFHDPPDNFQFTVGGGDGTSLSLVDVTFDLPAGKFVDFAAIDATTRATSATNELTFLGTSGSETFGLPFSAALDLSAFQKFDTAGLNIGAITGLRISANRSFFDNLTINVVPEPGALLLAVAGIVVGMVRSRWRQANCA